MTGTQPQAARFMVPCPDAPPALVFDLDGTLCLVHGPQTPRDLVPDAARLLRWLPPTVPIGLIGSGEPEREARRLRALGVAERFDHVVLPGSRTAHARAFETMERRLGRRGRSLVYVAARPSAGFAAARARGWMTVGVARTDGVAPPSSAETTIDSLDELVETVAALALTALVTPFAGQG